MRSHARLAALAPWAGLLVCAGFAAPAAAAPAKLVGKPSTSASGSTQEHLRAAEAIESKATFERRGSAVRATGWVSEIHDLADGAKVNFVLHTEDGRRVPLAVPKKTKLSFKGEAAGDDELHTGHVVTLDGTGGGTVTASSITVAQRLDLPALRAIEQASDREIQKRSVLVVPINFPEDRSTPVTTSTLQTEFFSTSSTVRSVANFYDRSARGRMQVTGAVTPWLELSTTRSECDFVDWGNEAEQQLRARGIEPDDYDQISLVPAWTSDASAECDEFFGGAFNGVSWGPRTNLTWANINNLPFRTGTAAHEIGHSFGLAHSNARECEHATEPVPLNDESCFEDDNGGDVDVMGGTGTYRTLQAYQRAKLGLLPGERIGDISADGTTHVLTREAEGNTLGSGKQVLRLRRKSAPSEVQDAFYYLEYRRPVAPFDRYAPGDSSLSGVTVHAATDHRGDEAAGWARVSPVRISATPGARALGNAKQFRTTSDGIPENGDTALRAGDSLYDPIENVTITVVSLNATQAEIKVTPGTPASDDDTLVYVNGNQLFVYSLAAGKRSRLSMTSVGTKVVISDYTTPVTADSGCEQLTTYSVTCDRAAIYRSYVALGDGDDSLWVGEDFPGNVRARPGGGDDSVIGGLGSTIQYIAENAADGRDALASKGRLQLDYSLRSAAINVAAPGDDEPIRITGSDDDFVFNTAPIEFFGTDLPGIYNLTDLTVVGTSLADTFNVQATRPTLLDGGPGVDTVTAGGAATTIISSDGATESGVSCSAGARLVRDAADAATGCTVLGSGPQARITGAADLPSEWTTVGPMTFTSSSTVAGLGYRCKWTPTSNPTGGTWSACTSGWTPPITANGSYRVSVQATVNGTPSGIEQFRTVRRQTTAATTQTVALGAVDPLRRVAKLAFNGSVGGTSHECSSTAGVWLPCGDEDRVAVRLASTASQLRVRAVSKAGVPASTPQVVDLPATPEQPKAYFKGGPNAGTVLATASTSLDFAADLAGSTFECRLDGGAWAACAAPKAYSGLTNGEHVFELRAVKDGLYGPTIARTFTVSAVTAINTPTAATLNTPVNLTTGTNSWIHWNGLTSTSFVRSVGQARVSTWTPIGTPALFARGVGTLSWTNALVDTTSGGSPSGSSTTGVAFRGNGNGLRLTVPANSAETRTLKLYVGLRGTATRAAVRASWAGGAVSETIVAGTFDYSLQRYVVTIPYRPSKPVDTLTVDVVQTAGTTASPTEVALGAATVS